MVQRKATSTQGPLDPPLGCQEGAPTMCSSSSATLVIGVFAKRRPWGRVPSLASLPILQLCLIDSPRTLVCMCPAPDLQEGGAEKREEMGGTRQAERGGEEQGWKGRQQGGGREGQIGTGSVCQGWSLPLVKLGHQGSGHSP